VTIVAQNPQRFQCIQDSLTLFWPDPPEDVWLVVSWTDASKTFPSAWFRYRDLAQAVTFLEEKSREFNTYVGMGLRHATCQPGGRGTNDDVAAIGGLWIEFDDSRGVHTAKNLPTAYQLAKFIKDLPFEFSLLIDSTGGLHGHLLFKEVWVLNTPTEHAAASLLLRRLQRTIQIAALAQGWKVDTTADLARVLRPAGTFNYKSGTPQPVTIAETHPIRYNPGDLADAPWLAEVVDTYTPPTGSGDFADAHLDRMVDGCAWLRHCRDDATTLPEPEWYGMLGLVGRCIDGEQHAHEWSTPYPHYDQAETTKKLRHALKAAGPVTCGRIRYDLSGESYCAGCVHWQQILSPMNLAMDDGVRLATTPPVYTKPIIKISPDIADIADQAERALIALPGGPHVYQRARQLVTITSDIPPLKWLRRSPDMPVIVEARPPWLREAFGRAATWAKLDKRSGKWETALPPAWAVETLLARTTSHAPVLEGLVFTPTFRPDGTMIETPGYDKDTGLFFHPNGIAPFTLSTAPTKGDAQRALRRLSTVFRDFPFAADHHRSTVYAAILSLLARYAIMGTVPLFGVRSTTRGAGKGLLIDVISMIGTGRAMARMAQTRDEEEERKRMITLALSGIPALHIDNVTAPLGSGALDGALTGMTVTERVLGTNEQREAPINLVFFASGNNMQFRSDTARRTIPIDLAPMEERPDERTGFRHVPLLPWVQRHRRSLVRAALTVLKAFYVAKQPAQPLTPFGSYEAWSDLIRACLVWAGEADPCTNRHDLEIHSDPEYENIAALLMCWQTCYGNTAVALKRIIQDALHLGTLQQKAPANHWDELRDALGAFDSRYDGQRLRNHLIGQALRKMRGRVVNELRLVGTHNIGTNTMEWKVEKVF
jgi:hypothetical protein